jgi:hypothetical protein
MDLTGIISVAGMGGLYKVIAQTKNGLLVESISDGKRQPVYSTSKVSALDDISIYGQNDDIPLKSAFKAIRDSSTGVSVPGGKDSNDQIKKAFSAFIPEYDTDRVYASDMKKVFTWYSILLEKGLLVDSVKEEEQSEESTAEKAKAEKITAKPKAKEVSKSSTPKASSKAMAKTPTVRKTGG